MKQFKILPVVMFAFLALAFSSCTKDVEDNLPGTWDMVISVSAFGISDNSNGSATFNEDGTGTWSIDGDTENIIWSSTEETVTISVDNDPITLDIVTNKKDEQEWTTTMTEVEDGLPLSYTITVKLTK